MRGCGTERWRLGQIAGGVAVCLALANGSAAQTDRPSERSQPPPESDGQLERQERKDSPTLFGDVAQDFGAMFTSIDGVAILGIGLAASSGAVLLDDEVTTSGFGTELIEGGFNDQFFEPAELMGSWMVQFGVPIVTYGVGTLAGGSEVADLSRDLIRVQILSQTLTQTIKRTARRARPDGSGNSSFPSGHTSATFAAATVFQRRYGWKAGVPAFAFATWVATSRLNEQKHWLSDLPFGAAIGVMAGRLVTRDLGGWTVAPLVRYGGGGVQFTLSLPS